MRKRLISMALVVIAGVGCAPASNGLGGHRNLSSYMYARGVFSGWEALDEYQLKALGDDRYGIEVDMTADNKPYYFKFADAGWVLGSNCGPLSNDTLELGLTLSANCSEPRRSFRFTPPTTGRYRLLFDNSRSEPQVSVEAL